jgi:glutamine amidotransferase
MIAIIDYGMANLRSVQKGLERVGAQAVITSNKQDIFDAQAVVLPGVGSFRECMNNLVELDLWEPLLKVIKAGKPYLGICLGMQILFSTSEEFGPCQGLDLIKGKVVRFPPIDGLKIPHMGWNQIHIKNDCPLLKDIPEGAYVYFVHSYYPEPAQAECIAATTVYGMEFASVIWQDNIFATQFHPEKSQQIGLTILKNFTHIY